VRGLCRIVAAVGTRHLPLALQGVRVSSVVAFIRLAEVVARKLGAAAMVLWARSSEPEGAKAPLEHLEPGLEGRLT